VPRVRLDRPAGRSRRLLAASEEAFAQRRKTMRNALRRLELDPGEADAVLEAAGVDPSARPEELSLDAFTRVADAMPA
jgi:16S rRNA (adenine1518-N6/adenine1519-N6)-dimethyltransferase